MSDNIFFNKGDLKSCGENVIIGKTVRIRYPELVEIGDNVIIDDFTYISTSLKINNYVHVSAGCKFIGGRNSLIEMKDFSTCAPNVVLASGSDDYTSGIATPLVPDEFKGKLERGDIIIGKHSIVGANSCVMPNVTFADGSSLGAISLAKEDLDPWSLYAGVPARFLKLRNKDKIIELESLYFEKNEK